MDGKGISRMIVAETQHTYTCSTAGLEPYIAPCTWGIRNPRLLSVVVMKEAAGTAGGVTWR